MSRRKELLREPTRSTFKDLTGMTFTHLRVRFYGGRRGWQIQRNYWCCLCLRCGTPCIASSTALIAGTKKSCGCLRQDAREQYRKKVREKWEQEARAYHRDTGGQLWESFSILREFDSWPGFVDPTAYNPAPDPLAHCEIDLQEDLDKIMQEELKAIRREWFPPKFLDTPAAEICVQKKIRRELEEGNKRKSKSPPPPKPPRKLSPGKWTKRDEKEYRREKLYALLRDVYEEKQSSYSHELDIS